MIGQTTSIPQEVRVTNIPLLTARSEDLADVLAASVETVLHRRGLCCGRDSSLEDRVMSADAHSLSDVATKLQGPQHLDDGRPVTVTAEFWPAAAANSGQIIGALRANHPLLMQWNSHLYVVYGVLFNDAVYSSAESTQETYIIRKFLLQDLRYSDARRNVVFERDHDNWDKVQGFLLLDWKMR